MDRIRILLNACVLLPYQLADLLLRLADAELYEPLWSDEILREVERNLVGKFEISEERAARRLVHMQLAFPNALVEDYEGLVEGMTNDPKDRHVLAAAIRGGAALIVTANLKDFPSESLLPYDIQAVHPDDFLQDQLDLDRSTTLRCLREQRVAYTRPQFTVRGFYDSLAQTVPDFSALALAAERQDWDASQLLPLEITGPEEMRRAFFPDSPPLPTDPLGAAMLWWTGLLSRDQNAFALEYLTWHPPAWGEFEEAFRRLKNAGMMQFVESCSENEQIKYVKFMPEVEQPMRAFAAAPLPEVEVLTMVRCDDGVWRTWGLSRNRFPSAAEVYGAGSRG